MSGLMLISPLLIMSPTFVRNASFKCIISGSLDLSDEAAIVSANALLSSCLDNCNSLFRSRSNVNMRKLQCIQNTLARIVTICNKYTRVYPILKRLHWLPVEFRCIFKTATLVYKFLHSGHPSYIGSRLSTFCGRYITRNNHPDKRFLVIPQFCPSVHKYKKSTLATAFLLMLQWFEIICLMRFVLPQLMPVSEKG